MKKEIKVGDLVVRKSYNKDILFRVITIDKNNGMAILKGIDWRLVADSPMDDLEVVEKDEEDRLRQPFSTYINEMFRFITQSRKQLFEKKGQRYANSNQYVQYPGRVFHLDGDAHYLKMCLKEYEKLGIPAAGVHMAESDMPKKILPLVKEYLPDIIVITGHDSYRSVEKKPNELNSYRNSKYFIEAVKIIRKQYERNRDSLVIFAGACQSYYEAIMFAGANFASSPERINIHALDPVFIVEKISFTPIQETIPLKTMIESTKSGQNGIGGIECKGTFRLGLPKKNIIQTPN